MKLRPPRIRSPAVRTRLVVVALLLFVSSGSAAEPPPLPPVTSVSGSPRLPGKPEVQPSWLPFVRVKSVRESVALAKRLGGKTLIEPKPELIEGKAAVIADPAGGAIGLLEWSDDLLKGGR